MDPAQLASEATTRLLALQTARLNSAASPSDAGDQSNDALLAIFDQLGQLDGWAKIAMDRLAADPQDARAAQDLSRSLEHNARLHPYFIRRLTEVLGERPAVNTSIKLPQQPSVTARAPSA